jgi:hypothetical protein
VAWEKCKTLVKQQLHQKGQGVVQAVECLSSKHKTLSSNPSTAPPKKKKKKSVGEQEKHKFQTGRLLPT